MNKKKSLKKSMNKSASWNKKMYMIIGCVTAAVIILILILAPKGDNGVVEDSPVSPKPTDTNNAGVTVDDPHTGEVGNTPSPTYGSGGVISLTPIDEPSSTYYEFGAGATAAPAADPVTGQTPDDDGPGGPGSHGQGNTGEYHCHAPNHHCDSPETHAYILNLEAQGCPYCGRHDCPSFYAVDEWGTACYDPTKCPQYDVHLDPVYYCQHCHKPCGDGTNGTCVRFVHACHCPICGKWVEAFTCHSCEQ